LSENRVRVVQQFATMSINPRKRVKDAALLLSGCSYKNEAIPLQSYKARYSGETAPKNATVYLALVKDAKIDKRTLGYVKDIQLTHTGETFGKNLKGGEILTLNFKQKSDVWMKPSRRSKDLEPFLHELFSDSLNAIVSKLATL
jgi:hypothetical protein